MRVLAAALLLVMLAPAISGAQSEAQPQAQPQALPPELPAELELRPEAELADFANRLQRRRRIQGGEPFLIGDAPPSIPEAIRRGQVALVRENGMLRIILAGDSGMTYAVEIPVQSPLDSVDERATLLAIASLLDTAEDAEVSRDVRSGGPGTWSVVETRRRVQEREDRERVAVEPIAKPTFYFRMLLGVSPLRGNILLGPGTGLGLCVSDHCVVIEGDLSLVSDTRDRVSYRPVNFAARLQIRPWTFDWFAPALTVGFLTRIGNAVRDGESRVVTNLGLRGSVELGARFAPLFEFVLDMGVDYAISQARFFETFLEDRWTPWIVTSVRLRPRW